MSESTPQDQDGALALQSLLVANSKWNLIAFSVAVAANFVTIPFVINAIGLAAFGVGGLILAVLAPLTLIGTVLGQATLREVAHRYATTDLAGANRIFATATMICGVSCVVIVLAFSSFGESAIRLFAAPEIIPINWQIVFLVATVGWAAQQQVLIFQSAVAATQRYALMAAISIVALTVSAASIMLGVLLFPTVLGYLSGTSVGFIFALIVWWIMVRWRFPWLFPLRRAKRTEFRDIVNFGKWQAASHFTGAIGNQMDRYVLGALAPVTVVGQYNVAMRLQEAVHIGVLKAGEVLFPHFSVTSNDPIAQRASFFIGASWVLNTVAACALVPLIPLSDYILTLWVNHETAEGAAPILRTLAAAGVVGSGVHVYLYYAMGTAQTAKLAMLTLIHSMLTISLTIYFIKLFGPSAAGLGILIAGSARLIFVLWLSLRAFAPAVGLGRLVVCTVPPLVSGLIVSLSVYRADLLSPTTWPSLILSYAVISISVALSSIALTSLSAQGRSLVIQTLRTTRGVLLKRGG